MEPSYHLYPRPRILVSPCLAQVACRYDATTNPCPALGELAPWVSLIDLCPEVEAGLPVPRPPMQYVKKGASLTLRRELDATDLLPGLAAWAASRVKQLGALEGGIFKARSPSCAIGDCKLHQDTFDGPLLGQVPGFFVQALAQARPNLALITEEDLLAPGQRNLFLTQAFVLARYRQASDIDGFLAQHAFWLQLYEDAGGLLHQAARMGRDAFAQALRPALSKPLQVQKVAEMLALQARIPVPNGLNSTDFAHWGQGLVLKYGKKFPWITLIFYPFPPQLA